MAADRPTGRPTTTTTIGTFARKEGKGRNHSRAAAAAAATRTDGRTKIIGQQRRIESGGKMCHRIGGNRGGKIPEG